MGTGGFDVRAHFESVVANAMAELRRLPEDKHANVVHDFLLRMMGASHALVEAGLVDRDQAWTWYKEAAQPLYETGFATPVEFTIAASISVQARPDRQHPE